MSHVENVDDVVFDPNLTKPDVLVLQNLVADIREYQERDEQLQRRRDKEGSDKEKGQRHRDAATITALAALNDPKHALFEPTVFSQVDTGDIRLPPSIDAWIFRPYVRVARSIVRVETDVVMLTHLLLYFSTSVPSAMFLFWKFTWVHGLLHFIMQVSYMGTYTLMMHQHIHMRGILNKRLSILDSLFPYITDPLMGHTWNSYYYHHVKHHHVEGNGPDDLSSTIRYQRDNVLHFLHYTGRFFFLIWLDLPLYFIRKGWPAFAIKAAFWELSWYTTLYTLYQHNPKATFTVFLLPLLLLRSGLMLGNWGQHAFVDHDEPNSDYRSSITLIDVPSNRYCFNDGYHTSHHLNPRRHWREHPVSFMKSKELYAVQKALVFHNIDYLMITVRLLMKDYRTLARCMIPIGEEQMSMSIEDRMALLRSHTQMFTEKEIQDKFKTK
ncbi:acylamide-delta3(E)-desaturase [Metarhizium anisopliae]|nr:acylamide-delta3(E)-desaturase [Metarhizium anisopliae]